MIKLKKYEPRKCSPEVIDIIERMPTSFGKRVSLCVIVLTIIVLVFGWIVKYPDTVSGIIKISSNIPPVKLVANTTGNISLIKSDNKTIVNKNDYIAIIQNSATTKDVLEVKRLLGMFDPTNYDISGIVYTFPDQVFLGELNIKYYTFLTALNTITNFYADNIYERQKTSLIDNINGLESISCEIERAIDIIAQKISISSKWDEKYRSLDNDNSTYEYEMDKSRNELLSLQEEEISMQRELLSIRIQIIDNRNRLAQIKVEQNEEVRRMKQDIITSYHDLCDNITAWEQKYVLKAPLVGQLEYLKFISNNQYIQAGEELFGIIPDGTEILGQVLLPANGAGKIKIGSKVTIKLDDYPYMEYGSVEGIVKNISRIAQLQKTGQNQINTYLVEVALPNELLTNYGKKLKYKPDISGVADIVVNERRLIERLFDNLKYKTR